MFDLLGWHSLGMHPRGPFDVGLVLIALGETDEGERRVREYQAGVFRNVGHSDAIHAMLAERGLSHLVV